jgi:serine/threonine-protein kinase
MGAIRARAFALFREVLDLPADQQAAFLEAACAGDAVLREHIDALRRFDASNGSVLDATASDLAGAVLDGEPAADEALLAGTELGPYRLVREIGRGGMGVVWLAERDDVGNRVALKMLRGALAAPEHERRFLHERRLLARLRHPNIAQLLDAGVAADGTPWYAMEYVEGEAIDQFCDQHRLTVAERIALFSKVVAAVAFAHRNLIVHRDIKPANILVQPDGEPKLLDFGIAKLIEDDDSAELTRTGLHLMTPDYAAPEQIKGEAITTATDVFALGAVLFLLLTGQRARRMRNLSLAELGRAASETDPARPSHAIRQKPSHGSPGNSDATLAEIAAARSTDPRRLRRRLRGELDSIVETAMALELDRRYASAEALGSDLRAYRAGEPVSARPATWVYRTRRFLARNAVVTAAAALLLVITSGFSALHSVRITRERNLAQLESRKASQVTSFLQDLFAGADPTDASGRATTAVDLLDRGLERIDSELADQPDVQADVLAPLADVFVELGLFPRAERAARAALDLRASPGAADAPNKADIEVILAGALFYMGRDHEAIALIDSAIARSRGDTDTANRLEMKATIARRLGDLITAELAFNEAFDLHRTRWADTAAEMLTARNNYGHLLIAAGRYAEAERLYREVYDYRVRTRGKEQTQTQTTMVNLVRALRETGKWREAEALGTAAVELRKRALGPDHVRVGAALRNLGLVQLDLGEHERAIATLEEGLRILVAAQGPDHIENAEVLTALGRALSVSGKSDSARVALNRVFAIYIQRQETGHARYADALTALAEDELLLGNAAAAERLLRAAERILRKALGNDHPQLAVTLDALGQALAGPDLSTAEQVLSDAYRIRRERLGEYHPLTQDTRSAVQQLNAIVRR